MALSGETDLFIMLRTLKPILHSSCYMFLAVKPEVADQIPRECTQCEFREVEGVTLVIEENVLLEQKINSLLCDESVLGKNFEQNLYRAAWIQLEVHSALEAVGLTAAFAKCLGDAKISCNGIAGYYHDHLFVDFEKRFEANRALDDLGREHGGA